MVSANEQVVFIVRHCQSSGQEPTAELTDVGLAQSLQLSDFLLAFAPKRIITSQYTRAQQSVHPLSEKLLITIERDARLNERTLGEITDGDWITPLKKSYDELDFSLPGGETSRNVMARGRAMIDQIFAEEILPAVVVSHGNIISLIARSIDQAHGFDFWKNLSNPDVIKIKRCGTSIQLEKIWKGNNSCN